MMPRVHETLANMSTGIHAGVDISMPRDLVRRRRNAGYAAICAIGVSSDPKVFRLGTAENVEGVLAQLQPGTWEKLHFARLVWTQGLAVARTIVTGAERALETSARPLGGHWYRGELSCFHCDGTIGWRKRHGHMGPRVVRASRNRGRPHRCAVM